MRLLSFDIGLRNLSLAKLSYESADEEQQQSFQWSAIVIDQWERIDCVTEAGSRVKNVKSIPTYKGIVMIRDALLRRATELFTKDLDFILIEQQPTSRGGGKGVGGHKNKVYETAVYLTCDMYYRLKLGREPPQIKLISPKLKLTVEIAQGEPKARINDPPETYYQRKRRAETLCKIILKYLDPSKGDNQRFIDSFQSKKQKEDDRADAFLQGIKTLQDMENARGGAVTATKTRRRKRQNGEGPAERTPTKRKKRDSHNICE